MRASPFVDSELLARGQVLESELPVAAEEEGKEPKQAAARSVVIEPDSGGIRTNRSTTLSPDPVLAMDRLRRTFDKLPTD